MGARNRLGFSTIEVMVASAAGIAILVSFGQVMMGSREDLGRLNARLAVSGVMNSFAMGLSGNIGGEVMHAVQVVQALPMGEEGGPPGPEQVQYLPVRLQSNRTCRESTASNPILEGEKNLFDVVTVGGEVFRVGKPLAEAPRVKVDAAALVQLTPPGVSCVTGENSPCRTQECSFMAWVRFESPLLPGGSKEMTLPMSCTTRWVGGNSALSGEEIANCRISGPVAGVSASPSPSESPSPCVGDLDHDAETSERDYELALAITAGSFPSPLACDVARLYHSISPENAIVDDVDFYNIKVQIGCRRSEVKRCFVDSPAYGPWMRTAAVWPPMNQITDDDLFLIDFCRGASHLTEFPAPYDSPAPIRTCASINIDGRSSGVAFNYQPVDSRDVELAYRVAKTRRTGPAFAAGCAATPAPLPAGVSCSNVVGEEAGTKPSY
jgi:hypothetical protein